jgi:hypothetical protein
MPGERPTLSRAFSAMDFAEHSQEALRLKPSYARTVARSIGAH